MACFVVPMLLSAASTAFRKHGSKDGFLGRNVSSLEQMFWGGTIMLIVDHIINGELTWRFPFFTALSESGGGAVMLREMLTVGVPMSLAIIAVWGLCCFLKERRTSRLSVE